MAETFTERVRNLIKNIPPGRVATYGLIAAMAGNPRAARQVVWVLHSSSEKYDLPWHRVINSKGKISLSPGDGFELQKKLLTHEGIEFTGDNQVNLSKFLWNP
ncbi:MAG: MGMT family protein [Spirochaetales bacterium]|nr:MGMT family protein [Spirochaetales bacterium]